MFGRTAGTVALLEGFIDRPLLECHCIIQQEYVGKVVNFQHAMISVVKCANKIRARGLSRREFRENHGLLDMQSDDLILH